MTPQIKQLLRESLERFGLTEEDLEKMAEFDGDITCGPPGEDEDAS